MQRNRNSNYVTLIASITILITALSAQGSQIIFLGSGSQRTDGGKVVGTTLNAVSPQLINAVGFLDVGDDGINASYTIGVWDSSQNLVTSGVVTPSSPLINDFRWTAVSPVTLPAGAFTIGALLPAGTSPDPWLDNANLSLAFGVTGAGQGSYTNTNALTYPATIDTGNNYIAANAGDVSVPEPASLTLLTLTTLPLFHRRRKIQALRQK